MRIDGRIMQAAESKKGVIYIMLLLILQKHQVKIRI